MTDKQIIIDGVNVKDCKRRIGKDNFCRYHKRPCAENNYNCIWKKYLRKEQECEALQMSENEAVEIIAELKAYKDVNEDFKTAWEELKAENDELKKIVNEAKNSKLDLKSFLVGEAVQNEYEQKLDQLKAENEELKKNLNEGCLQHLTLMTEQQVLLKTLAEIKEIAERRNYLDYNECLDDILQKISECEVKNDNK